MKSLVESILDVDDNIAIGNEIASKVFRDEKLITNLYVEVSDYTYINPAEFIDYKKLMKEVRYMTKYGGWKIDKYDAIYDANYILPIVVAFVNQPLLSYEQNFLAYIKNFAKGEVIYTHYEYKTSHKDRFIYTFKGKGRDLEIIFVVKDR